MNRTKQGKAAKLILFVLLVLFVFAILALPFGLKFLTIPEQIFLLGLVVFFLIYTKVFAGYNFINVLLDLIANGDDVFDHLAKNLSKDSLFKYLAEGELMVVTETQYLKVKEMSSNLFDMTLLYLFALFVVAIAGILPMPIFYAATLPAVIVVVFAWLVELYLDVKFVRVFSEEIKELEALARALNLENKLVEQMEDEESDEENNKEKSKTEENQSK